MRGQDPPHEATVGGPADTNGNVDAVADDVAILIRKRNLRFHLGPTVQEALENGQNVQPTEGDRHIDAKAPSWGLVPLCQGELRVVHF